MNKHTINDQPKSQQRTNRSENQSSSRTSETSRKKIRQYRSRTRRGAFGHWRVKKYSVHMEYRNISGSNYLELNSSTSSFETIKRYWYKARRATKLFGLGLLSALISTAIDADIIGGIDVKPDYQNDKGVQKAVISYQEILDKSGIKVSKEQPCDETDPEYNVEGIWGACEDLNNAISAFTLKQTNERITKLKIKEKNLNKENTQLEQDLKALKAIQKPSK